jgi:adenylate cyclase
MSLRFHVRPLHSSFLEVGLSERDLTEISDWIIESGLIGLDETEIIDGVCQRLNASGTKVMRAQVGQRVLHPIYAGVGFRWERGKGTEKGDWERQEGGSERRDIMSSPFGRLFKDNVESWRFKIEGANEELPYPILEELREQGATDYVTFASGFAEGAVTRTGARGFTEGAIGKTEGDQHSDGMVSSWTVDQPDGYTDGQLDELTRVVRTLGLAIKSGRNQRMARTLLEVYLGKDAGRRVLSGEIERGMVRSISAVLWYCDLQGFTKIADTTPPDELIKLLNDYFENMVEPIHAAGGQVLKFMGDGLMAIFELDKADNADVCRIALDTVEETRRRISEVNVVRKAAGQPTTEFYIAMHLGDVQYGNIGSKDRLDFTVVGPAVNEVSRIEAMCRPLEQDVIVSSAFSKAAANCQDRLVSLGRYALRGVRRPEELFTVMPPEDA